MIWCRILLLATLFTLPGCVISGFGGSKKKTPEVATVSRYEYDAMRRQAADKSRRLAECEQLVRDAQVVFQEELETAKSHRDSRQVEILELKKRNALMREVLERLDHSSPVQMNMMSSREYLQDALARQADRLKKFHGIKEDITAGLKTGWDTGVVNDKIDEAQMKMLYLGYTLFLIDNRSVDLDALLKSLEQAERAQE